MECINRVVWSASTVKNPLSTFVYVGTGYFIKGQMSFYFLPGGGITYNFTDDELIPEAGLELGYDFISLNIGYRFGEKHELKRK